MADPKGINPPTPNTSTQRKDDDQENTTFLNLKTVGDLKKVGAFVPSPNAAVLYGFIPRSYDEHVQNTVKKLNLPGLNSNENSLRSVEIFGSDNPNMNPNRQQFTIPGYDGGKWALSVDRAFVGEGKGQLSAERWANVAKNLGQSTPLAAPRGPQ